MGVKVPTSGPHRVAGPACGDFARDAPFQLGVIEDNALFPLVVSLLPTTFPFSAFWYLLHRPTLWATASLPVPPGSPFHSISCSCSCA